MEFEGDPKNRSQDNPMSWQQRYDRFGNWSYGVEGTGQQNRGADPSTLLSGGSGSVRRDWVESPYNANARAREQWWTASWRKGSGSSSSSGWHSYRGAHHC